MNKFKANIGNSSTFKVFNAPSEPSDWRLVTNYVKAITITITITITIRPQKCIILLRVVPVNVPALNFVFANSNMYFMETVHNFRHLSMASAHFDDTNKNLRKIN